MTLRQVTCGLLIILSESCLLAEEDFPTREQLLNTEMPEWSSGSMSEEERDRANHYFSRMVGVVEAAYSGIVSATETDFDSLDDSGRVIESTWRMAFDRSQDWIRFDLTQNGRIDRYANNDQEALYRVTFIGDGFSRPIHRHPVGWNELPVKPPDTRLIGIAGQAMYSVRYDFNKFKEILDQRVRSNLVDSREAGGLLILLAEFNATDSKSNDAFRFAQWIDPEMQDAPVRTAQWRKKAATDTAWLLTNVSATQWETINAVPVPTKSLAISNQGKIRGLSIDLTWESVNEAIPPSVFGIESFDLPIKTQIVSHKSGKRVVESRVGEPKLADIAEQNARAGRLRFWIVLCNAILLLVIAGYWFFIHRKKSSVNT